MAIIANRVRNSSNISEFTKSITIFSKHFFILFFLILSLYLFVTGPKKFSNISLEITGGALSIGLKIYENIFDYINGITHKLVYFQDLAKKNIELQLEIAKLQHMQNNIDAIRAENIALRNLLTVTKEEEFVHVTAKLLSVSLNPFSKSALIAAGKKHGIEVDQVVINAEGLVGRVTEVSNNYSKIMLINDVNSRIPITAGSSREKGILAGNGNGGKILYLPDNHLIQKDEKIITSGHGNIYPSGILLGYADKVTEKDITVSMVVDLSKTEFVQILLPKE
ncbi:rod shape-determining protein MreC [Rickettsia endosymbiont of Halotydeus destructor]|uniref:rod shape-determining protein MreC n=1 Tax=Rickettsia endosymbiont of Halotydeus destructor TaxID=2996754 RepID=UPI003BAFFF83